MPTLVLYTDVRFGFDGGRHALMQRKLAEARVPDWPWSKEMMQVDSMAVVSVHILAAPTAAGEE